MTAIRTWPTKPAAFTDARALFWRHIFKTYEGRPFIRPDTVFTTLGSCFANNLGSRLQAQGYRVHNEWIGEEINSTYANRYLLSWIAGDPVQIDFAQALGLDRDRLRQQFAETNAFVITLGVAPCFFDADGRFVLRAYAKEEGLDFLAAYRMRTTTFAENLENIGQMMSCLRRLADDPVIVLTISPIPLIATTEFYSAVVADCVSKSVLRTAAHEYLVTDPEVIYWPSFEMARWLGPFLPDAFGADGNMRHVSPWLVDMITESFLTRHLDRQAAGAPEAPAESEH